MNTTRFCGSTFFNNQVLFSKPDALLDSFIHKLSQPSIQCFLNDSQYSYINTEGGRNEEDAELHALLKAHEVPTFYTPDNSELFDPEAVDVFVRNHQANLETIVPE